MKNFARDGEQKNALKNNLKITMENAILVVLLLLTVAQLSGFILWLMEGKRRKKQEREIFLEIDYLTQLIREDLNEQSKVIDNCEVLAAKIFSQERDFKEFGQFISKVSREIRTKNLMLKNLEGKIKSSSTK